MSVLFRGATVVDGTGAPGRQADVLVVDGRIESVGSSAAGATDVIDADGLVLAPGFIDLHSHADLTIPAYPSAVNSLSQGVTTEVVGNCGFSPAPVSPQPAFAELLQTFVGGLGPDLAWNWTDFATFVRVVDEVQPSVNVAPLVGHGTLRIAAMGMEDRPSTPDERSHMRTGLHDALAAGAWGLSTGLVYPPGAYAVTDEII
jgi:N-acyl-D-amino-acid deacylase